MRHELTNKQCVPIVLQQNTADTGDVFYGKLKHHQVHGRLTDQVILLQVAEIVQHKHS